MYRRVGKRAMDLVLTLVMLVALAPLMAAVALTVRLKLGRPVLYRQERPGLDGELFTMLKFRTMVDGNGADGAPLPDGERLTRLGAALRRTSLDELPQLFNVLRGEMSLVGPRPLLVEYLARYTPEQMRRHEVLPGITGWAQVNGRNVLAWNDKFAQDIWYVDHLSPGLDLKILALTPWKIVRREGISHPGQATMREFTGSDS